MMKQFVSFIVLSFISIINYAQCDLEASFEYELDGDTYYFFNTSTGAGEEPTFQWYVDDFLWSDTENPTLGAGDVEPGTIICLVITTGDGECVDEICMEVGEDPCDLEASFEYELDGDTYYFFNTSTGADEEPTFQWYVDDFLWSDTENPTLGGGDVEPGTIICLVITTGDGECVDEICMEVGEDPCDLEASFEYELDGDTYYFFNTSSGAGEEPTFQWYVDDFLWSDTENPTLGAGDVEPGTIVCLVITTGDGECVDEICIEVGEDPCDLEASFEYELDGDTYYFFNTSTGAGEEPTFQWYVDDFLWSDTENPTLGAGDVEPGTIICLVITTGDGECVDEICMEVGEDPCELEVSFEYVILDEVIYFTNTSTGEGDASIYSWSLLGTEWSDDEHPTLPLDEVEEWDLICLEIYDEITECEGEHCIEIELGEEPPCETFVDFTMEVIGAYVYFVNTSVDLPDAPSYTWYDDGTIFSDDEHPIIPISHIDAESDICLKISSETDGCSISSCKEYFSETELNISNNDLNRVKLYPNPAINELIIENNSNEEIKEVLIYNTLGEIVQIISVNVTNSLVKIDINALERGVYFLQISYENGVQTEPQQLMKN